VSRVYKERQRVFLNRVEPTAQIAEESGAANPSA
jgi:hypothetical protein